MSIVCRIHCIKEIFRCARKIKRKREGSEGRTYIPSMPITREYRISLPMTVEEYNIAQLYMVARVSKEESENGSGEGVEVLVNEPYEDEEMGKGQYTHKIIHLGSRLPGWISAILPSSAQQLEEKAWNAYPHCKTVYSCPFFGDRFSMEVKSVYVADSGDSDNVHAISPGEWADVSVDKIDVVNDSHDDDSIDLSKFRSEKTGRGPFCGQNWESQATPVMTCYKLCTAKFQFWPLGGSVEEFIHSSALRNMFLKTHKQCILWMDDWSGLTIEDIRNMEHETKEHLHKIRAQKVAEEK